MQMSSHLRLVKEVQKCLSMCEDKSPCWFRCMMRLLTMFILSSKTVLKNQRAQSVVFCSNLKILSPKSSVYISLRNPTKLSLFRLQKHKIWLWSMNPDDMQTGIRNINFPHGSYAVTRQLAASNFKWSGLMSGFEETEIIMTPSSTKEIHRKECVLCHLIRAVGQQKRRNVRPIAAFYCRSWDSEFRRIHT
jgi:hypothetical protein